MQKKKLKISAWLEDMTPHFWIWGTLILAAVVAILATKVYIGIHNVEKQIILRSADR